MFAKGGINSTLLALRTKFIESTKAETRTLARLIANIMLWEVLIGVHITTP